MHYQADAHGEAKLVRVPSGAIYDVIIDLRPESETFKRWFGIELSAGGSLSLFVPTGFAHGFQTLVDGTEVHYQMSHEYVPEAARRARFDDPAFGISISWPPPPPEGLIVSEQDRSFADFGVP